MPRGYWRIVLAALGLAAIGGVLTAGYYQLEQAEQQPYAEEEYQPARDARLPVAVKKGQPTAPEYQPHCRSPQSRDDADLCAQWAAVQATSEANRLNRIGLHVTYWEMCGLAFSLIFTGWAAFAAAQQVRHSRQSLAETARPFVFSDGLLIKPMIDRSTNLPTSWRLAIGFRNGGSTPAHRTVTQLNVTKRKEGLPEDFEFPDNAALVINPTFLGPGAQNQSGETSFSLEEVKDIREGILRCFMWGWVEYSDRFEGPRHRSEFAFEVGIVGDPFPDGISFDQKQLRAHNGADDYCFHTPKTTGYEKPESITESKVAVAQNIDAKVRSARMVPADTGWKIIFDLEIQNFGMHPVTIASGPVGFIAGELPPVPPQFEVTAKGVEIIPAKSAMTRSALDIFPKALNNAEMLLILNGHLPAYICGRHDIVDHAGNAGRAGYCYLIRFLGPDKSESSAVANDAYWVKT